MWIAQIAAGTTSNLPTSGLFALVDAIEAQFFQPFAASLLTAPIMPAAYS